jgi:hypothetical protein
VFCLYTHTETTESLLHDCGGLALIARLADKWADKSPEVRTQVARALANYTKCDGGKMRVATYPGALGLAYRLSTEKVRVYFNSLYIVRAISLNVYLFTRVLFNYHHRRTRARGDTRGSRCAKWRPTWTSAPVRCVTCRARWHCSLRWRVAAC